MGDHTDIHGPAAGASTVHGSASKATSNHVFSSAGTAAIKTFKTNDGTAYYEVQPKIESSAEEDLPRGSDKTVFVEIVAPDGDGADPRLALLKCLCPPPATSSCWGAAYGSLTPRHDGTNNVFLYCMNCGRDTWIPPLSDGMTPMGIYFDEYPTQLRAIIVCDDYPRLYFERINMDALPRWDEYPGTGQYHMSSVGFHSGTHFVGATASNIVVIDVVGGEPGHDLLILRAFIVENGGFYLWNLNNNHIFVCSEKIYLCVFFRSGQDMSSVRSSVFVLEQIDGENAFVPTNDVGDFAIYLGSNQPLVLPAEDN
ncbi:hypothetical protein OsJ_32182 [Oryza sativa Japonica Group]|uniref:Uncharacterized protein n=3 Tax=Oryza sativa subsp. japonica TaxID=39947 RepID=A0A8J8XF97_ORYSJ|nr:hypothetical protein LOC_Os10g37604 [Oryza sativa Japonica Group]EAZ16706.1 hypothetical protein OsJ_32182 [Oryza sativa Japonica Group]